MAFEKTTIWVHEQWRPHCSQKGGSADYKNAILSDMFEKIY